MTWTRSNIGIAYYLKPGHTAFRVLTASESRPKNGTREADAVKREEDAMKTSYRRDEDVIQTHLTRVYTLQEI